MSDPGDKTPDRKWDDPTRCICGAFQEEPCRHNEAPCERPRGDWPDRLGEMERDVTGCAEMDEQLRRIQDKMFRNWCRKRGIEPPAFVQSSNAHANWRATLEKAREFNALPDTHAEWRSLNESEDGGRSAD